MHILRHHQGDLPTGIINAWILSIPLWLLIALCLFALSANATSPTKQPVADPDVSAEADSASDAESSSDSSNAVSVDASRYGIALGGGASGSDSTAACLERRPSWGFGFRGDKTKLNATCWNEYVRQAEHEREMDLARLDLELERIQLERDRIALERIRLECIECGEDK